MNARSAMPGGERAPAPAPATAAGHLYQGYEDEIRHYRIGFSRVCADVAALLVLLGAGLDYGLYPQRQWQFLLWRILVALGILVVAALMKTRWGERRGMALTLLWLLMPQLMINAMIADTEGAASLYYAGLHLAVFASGIALPFSLRQNLLLGLLTFLFYVLACAAHPATFTPHGAFLVNSMLLLMSVTISAVCTRFNERARFTLFRVKGELAQKNRELEDTNRSLADIKGQMLQQEKMAALGTLAAGLLHEVNNPVNFCLMAIELASEEQAAKDSPMLTECLTDARQGMQRVQYIVSDLKTFAYRKDGDDLLGAHFLFERALSSALRLVGHELKDVKVVCNLPPDTLVRGDEAAIIGVLINLFSNAVLAMRKRGGSGHQLSVTARWDPDLPPTPATAPASSRLRVAVLDNGPGIAPQHLARVFEPFFTTREVGKGLGLGLSISYSVIERHGGLLTAESEVGAWTRMLFDLPRAESRPDARAELEPR